MENVTDHNELMIRLAVFEERVTGKLDGINTRLDVLNHKTSKNSGAIETLQAQERNITAIVASQKERDLEKERREDGWKRSWQNLLFGSLQWLVPAAIVGLLVNGKEVAEFLGFL